MVNKKECDNCGIIIPNRNKFCSNSCSSTFNNKNRVVSSITKEKLKDRLSLDINIVNKLRKLREDGHKINDIANILKISSSTISKYTNGKTIKMKNSVSFKCLNCDGELDTKRTYCDNLCTNKHKHKFRYEDFLINNEKYCVGNYTPKHFKIDFLKEQNGKCITCGCDPIWNGKILVFVLDHIDGDSSNNKRSNLRLVCPNCDSQLETFKSKNKNSSRRNYYRIINN